MAIRECLPRLQQIGITWADACALRRISMTLHRWHELECGDGHGCIEREEKWAIERAAWPASDSMRWWDGKGWNRKRNRRTYGDYEKDSSDAAWPADAAFRLTGEKPFFHHSNSGARYAIADREAGAIKRLKAIMARYPSLGYYIQGDPRGASLYILRPGDVPEGESADSYYSRGLAVYK